jgi:hypothetical protein
MKRILLLILILVILGFGAWGVRRQFEKQAEARRGAGYESAMRSVTQALKPGMTRKEVEGYLNARKMTYMQECCVLRADSDGRQSLDDLAKIGQESHPWFCSEHDVYLAFQFSDYAKQETTSATQDNDLDTLKAITIYHQLEGCL